MHLADVLKPAPMKTHAVRVDEIFSFEEYEVHTEDSIIVTDKKTRDAITNEG
jgi:hypothetical protein